MNSVMRWFFTGWFILCAPIAQANELSGHASPYLAMHGQDPVDWQEWGSKVFAHARLEGRLVFVSSGYFTCYWCHVLHKESFSSPDTAKILNQFLPVKVDRELRPGLDAMLIDFVESTRGHAGWPLNVFMTPDGYPLVGFTYLPPGQFAKVLANVERAWKKDPKGLAATARLAFETHFVQQEELVELVIPANPGPLLHQQYVGQVLRIADDISGGFGNQSKFPQVARIQALLQSYKINPELPLKQFLVLTLNNMAEKGLRDHIGGGFFRYTVDPLWQVPHFEKMLYGNALLASLFIDAAAILDHPEYRGVGLDTLNFMIGELQQNSGGMIAALSSVDDAGVEGAYYSWTEAELVRLLGKQNAYVARLSWELSDTEATEEGALPMQGKNLVEVANQTGLSVVQVTKAKARARTVLNEARRSRGLPRDDKQLAGWNGLALSALSRAVLADGGAVYRDAGNRVRAYLVDALWDGKQLQRALGASGSLGQSSIEDYAYVAQGLLDWSEATADTADRGLVRKLVTLAWQQFHNEQGWRLTDQQDVLPYDLREPLLGDGALVSPSAVLIDVSLRLDGDDGESALHRQAVAAITASYPVLAESVFSNPTHLTVLSRYQGLLPP